MSLSGLEYLRHILDETEYIVSQIEQLDYNAFILNETLKRAFVRSIEIIGEATKKLPDELKQRHPYIQWKEMAGMRDRLIHDYFGIDYDIVWDVVKNKIPLLLKNVRQILESEEQNS